MTHLQGREATLEATLGPLSDDLAAASLALARRFAAGGTMWCWAPGYPEHAQHIAVEFVHPVIVGKRALPSVALSAADSDAVGALRALVRAGDIVVVVGTSHEEPMISPVLLRCQAWGATTVWIGAGDRPRAGVADHVLWMDSPATGAAHGGEFVLAYHLLWELTHVCFEHPGLLTPPPECEGPVCTTCSDEGRLAEVISAEDFAAMVRTPSGVERIDTSLVGPVVPGQLVLVHAGSALTTVDER